MTPPHGSEAVTSFCWVSVHVSAYVIWLYSENSGKQGGLATAFDLAAFRLSMIAPVKKSVNHSRTVASMRETG